MKQIQIIPTTLIEYGSFKHSSHLNVLKTQRSVVKLRRTNIDQFHRSLRFEKKRTFGRGDVEAESHGDGDGEQNDAGVETRHGATSGRY